MPKARFIRAVLVLVLAGQLAFTCWVQFSGSEFARTALVDSSLIDRIRFYLDSSIINWTGNYFGLVFGEQNKTDFELYIDSLAVSHDWKSVLAWSVYVKKLGVERERAIRDALGNLSKVGEFPESGTDAYGSYWCVHNRDLLYATFYYANRYDLTEKWNVTKAYKFFKAAIEANSSYPALFYIRNDGQVWEGYDRYYDENAETISVYLIFYELGVDEALSEAVAVWNYVNMEHWSEATLHFNYGRTRPSFECEAAYFYRIASLLKLWDNERVNYTRILVDAQTRFLKDRWLSPQWTESEFAPGESGFVVMHHNPSNPQRRLPNTLATWFTLLDMYGAFDSECKKNITTMIQGYSTYDPAWMLLYDPKAQLFDSHSQMFKTTSTDMYATPYGTSVALTLQALMGIVPDSTTIAFPIEEYGYEYNYDIDPGLFRMDTVNNTLRIAVASRGALSFIYGRLPTTCDFPQSGIYNIAFSDDWNQILNVSRLQDLPSDRKYLPEGVQVEHNVKLVNVMPSENVITEGAPLSINATVQNTGRYSETFNITAHIGSTAIQTQTVTLENGTSSTLTFNWNTSGVSKGEYAVSAEAEALPGEIITIDNKARASELVTVVSIGHDIAVKSVTIGPLYTLRIVAKNYGSFAEDFNVTVNANRTIIMLQKIALGSGLSATFSFRWNTTGLRGKYEISVAADTVPNETDVTDNQYVYGLILIVVVDVTGPNGQPDGKCDMMDIAAVARLFGIAYPDPLYNLNCDVNDDGKTDMTDISLVARHFGEVYI